MAGVNSNYGSLEAGYFRRMTLSMRGPCNGAYVVNMCEWEGDRFCGPEIIEL
jgi:hypothetical protein